MSVAAIRRSFVVIHHLQTRGEARFTDLVRVLAPISRTALSHLLSSLEEIGELERCGRQYRLTSTAAGLAAPRTSIYTLPPALRAQTRPVLERLSAECGHSCALFARVGQSTMKGMDAFNLAAPHWPFPAPGWEAPLVPFHAFARVFLAYAAEPVASEAYNEWEPYLRPNSSVRLPANEQLFFAELAKVRRQGCAVEYKEEVAPIMRVAVPVSLEDEGELRFAVGIVAKFVYLLELDACREALRRAAGELADILRGRVPASLTWAEPSEFESNRTDFDGASANGNDFVHRDARIARDERVLEVG